jgi:HlyD family type I secretion membrane fusion protein
MKQDTRTGGAQRRGDEAEKESFSIRGHVVFAASVMLFLLLGVGGWAATANLTGAVIASGTFVVERNVKKVQHNYGGIVAKINVKNGDTVEGGDVLIRLDDTQIKAEMGIILSQLTEFRARAARLEAERENRASLEMPAGFAATSESAAAVAAGEIRLFEESRRTRENQKEQLQLRIEQLEEEIKGLSLQRDAKAGEIALIRRELEQVRMLHEKQLTPVSRVYAMERDEMRLSGEHGGLVAQIARAKGQISEIRVQILAVDENVRAQAQRELRAVEGRLAELAERQIATADKFKRIDLRAPQTGVVHELSVHTVGGVITAAEQVMLIVPKDEDLTIQARISPADIDQVVVGRPAKLRLSAFSQQTTPELSGRVTQVAADITADPKTGQSYYVVRLEMDEKDARTVADLKLVPGMPVEVFMSTGTRTALSYLAKPIADQMNRAFRE